MASMSRPTITTAEQLLTHRAPGRQELVRGELRVMSHAGKWHGAVAMRLGTRLFLFVEEHNLGLVFAAETGFVLARDPDTVLAPDVSFVRKDRLADVTTRGFFEGPPDLAVEVLSPDDTKTRVRDKVNGWLEHGTRLLWVVDPRTRRATVHHPHRAARTLDAAAVLDGEDVLPGLRLPVADLWPR